MTLTLLLLLVLVLLQLLILNVTTLSARNYQGNEPDILSLLEFKSILNDPNGVLNSWNRSIHFCNWRGITCGRKHTRVTILNLSSSGLTGNISPHIGNLTFLRQITLQNNTFIGQIPSEIGRLYRLQSIRLFNNSLEGKIPSNLFNCTKLILINVGNNNLSGAIPRELGSLSKLETLGLYQNKITGEIPSSIGNLTSIQTISISQNVLEGIILNTIGSLKTLTALGIGGNQLSGMVPSSVYNLSSLNILSLAVNQLEGTIPSSLGLSLPNLQLLELWGNQFTGTIPPSLGNLSELANLDLSYNSFTGNVPNFGGLQSIRLLNMDFNFLGSGQGDEMNFLNSLTNCTFLDKLGVNANQLGGVLPSSVGNLSTLLRYFGAAGNRISGIIPLGLSNLVNLEIIEMSFNQLRGQIPSDLGNIKNLQNLYLMSNQLSGRIPSSIGNLSFLSLLHLENNSLEGTIPPDLGNCRSLIELNLSQNNLNGTIPKELFSASALSVSLNLARNRLVGPIPSEIGNLKNLVELDLSKNGLSGVKPNELGECTDLVKLYLEGNFFEGSIPSSFKSLRGIQNLDISANNLSGNIPTFFANFSLVTLNLSFNNFECEVPSEGVFANQSAISVVGNNGLCGGISTLQLPKCKTTKLKKRRRLPRLQKIILIVAGCLVLSVSMVVLFVIYRYKKKKLVHSPGSLLKEPLLTVSYGDLLKATDGFSSTNLIGVGSFGSVYKGILDREQKTIAVKVIKLEQRGASKSFMAECEALRNIRHRNLVKIITSCSSIDFQGNDFKALVYEFMPNGSLEKWLRSPTDEGRILLDLRQRIDVAIDVVCALEYLHYRCEYPIVHCDLKPSNILLDNDMVAHVGDFGLARFLLQELSNANQSSSIGIRGTIGYIAPEYGQGGEVSTSGDIYSYGILLLEMMTGKSPLDPLFNEGLSLHNYAKTALPDHVMEIVEPKLILNNEEEEDVEPATSINTQSRGKSSTKEECVISMVKIGVACSVESPQNRMDLNQVIRELYSVKRTLGGA